MAAATDLKQMIQTPQQTRFNSRAGAPVKRPMGYANRSMALILGDDRSKLLGNTSIGKVGLTKGK